jgi:hypothetical protein
MKQIRVMQMAKTVKIAHGRDYASTDGGGNAIEAGLPCVS